MLRTIHVTKVFKYLSILLFLTALIFPCFDTMAEEGEEGEGAAILLSGFFGFFSSAVGWSWLANPALWVSWGYFTKKPRQSFLASAIAVLFALSFLFFKSIMINEAGGTSTIIKYRIGYWLWLGSSLVMLIGNTYLKYRNNRE
ncbi:hypothetical protein ACEN9X_06395 [Mucilaginibacter sp. Mucisp86]|uniref:hypothetical protein n=1 Tax=Mucilaginibacter sp. Mucisp86 TaxID=3243060 RepID=UPI0039B3B596